MKRNPVFLLVILLSVNLAACGGRGSEIAPSGPVVIASAVPPASPSPEPAVDSPTAIPPSVPAEGTSTLVPTTAAATAPATATSRPQASPEAAATAAASATPQPVADLSSLRVELQPVASGLETPVGLAHAGDGSGRLFVLEKAGRIRVVQDGVLLAAPWLDITDRVGSAASEQGLLGLAFHPRYAENGLFFVNYTDRQGDTVVARFSMAAGQDAGGLPVADPGSEMLVLKLDQPAGNHNGGHLAFGPDGYLYIGTGDGGGAGDQYNNGQNGATLLGAMLRLDVDGGEPYAIPADNPFTGDPDVRDEIWALGLRNPWRYSFDRLTGDLYIADVGQNVYEEVNLQPAARAGGQNYGWPTMEAGHCFPADRECDRDGLALPLLEYDHSQGCSITGGYVYRGAQFPDLWGAYLFGDYCSGRIWGVAAQPGGEPLVVELAQADIRLSSFGEDEGGELYILDMARGELFTLVVLPR
jgi:glucose/arabinose dehydrogenase